MQPATVPGGARRPGLPGTETRTDAGAIAVEAAYAMGGLVRVALALAWLLSLVGAQLAVGEAARAAARVAARGEADAEVSAEGRRLVPAAVVVVTRADGRVRVEVRRDVAPPGLLGRLGAVHLAAQASALEEQP
jgi:hypothetical protein